MSLLVRERPPLRLHAITETPSGRVARWGQDAHKAEDALAGLVFSSTMPGGFEQCSNVLARRPELAYSDLEELSTVTIRGAGGRIAWQGRLEETPRVSGSQSQITPQLVGWQSHMQDDNSAREIYLDVDQTQWQGSSVARRLGLLSAWDFEDPSTTPDPSNQQPSVLTQVGGTWSRARASEAWYDARGISLGALYFAWAKGSTVDTTDTNWQWFAALDDDDVGTAHDLSTLYRAAGPTSALLAATTATRKWARLRMQYGASAGGGITQGTQYPIYWTFAGVVGDHGLPIQGPLTTTGGIGILASDAVAHAIGTWAPRLAFTTGATGTIQPSTFAIPHLAFVDPTTAAEIVNGATAFDLQDWAVWDGPTFWWYPRGLYGRKWRARVGPSQLQQTGQSISRLWNGVIVTYNDVSGITRSVGPPGSGCNTEDASLLDTDPTNPANELGIRRWSPPLAMGVSTAAGAIKVGQIFLQEQKLLDTSGQAILIGHVEDEHGVLYPAWAVRAGDQISFTDSSDPTLRRIVRAEYTDDTKTCAISLDSPPDGMQQLLARLNVKLVSLGL